jgi:hypothetical protein
MDMIIYINKNKEPFKQLVNVIGRYFAPKKAWADLYPKNKHLEMMKIISRRRKKVQFTGISALLLYGIPHSEKYTLRPCCRKKICAAKKDEVVNWFFSEKVDSTRVIDGLRIVPPLEAIVDFSKQCSLTSLFIATNYCLHKKFFSTDELQKRFYTEPKTKGYKKIKKLKRFFNAGLESWLESIAWIEIYNSGLSLPELQFPLYNQNGFIARVDMAWKLKGKTLLVELDGVLKYTELADEMTLYKEKKRQELIELMPNCKVKRFGYEDVKNGTFIKSLMQEGIGLRRYSKLKFPKE